MNKFVSNFFIFYFFIYRSQFQIHSFNVLRGEASLFYLAELDLALYLSPLQVNNMSSSEVRDVNGFFPKSLRTLITPVLHAEEICVIKIHLTLLTLCGMRAVGLICIGFIMSCYAVKEAGPQSN